VSINPPKYGIDFLDSELSTAAAVSGRAAAIQRHGAGGAFAVEASPLGLASGGGRPLPEAVRGKMEAAFGADFPTVRVHVGPQAERIGANAFTIGSDIYFAPGRYQPETVQGRQLLGHELAHVVQQRAGRVRNPLSSGHAVVQDRALEAEADRLGHHTAALYAARQRLDAQPRLRLQANFLNGAKTKSEPKSNSAQSRTLQCEFDERQGKYLVKVLDRAYTPGFESEKAIRWAIRQRDFRDEVNAAYRGVAVYNHYIQVGAVTLIVNIFPPSERPTTFYPQDYEAVVEVLHTYGPAPKIRPGKPWPLPSSPIPSPFM
jgi:hypothetical protein